MSKQRHRRRSQGGTTPETTPQTGSGVAHFSVSEVAQFWMSVDKRRRPSKSAHGERRRELASGVAGSSFDGESVVAGGSGG